MSQAPERRLFEEAGRQLSSIKDNIRRSILGKDEVIDQVLVALIAGGHVLIEDMPGVGKTTLAYALARSVDCGFSRIQFTSDLLPGDVIGVAIYEEREKSFVFKKGPVFSNIVLADEINRATPKTQSALLEVMERGRLSVDGETHSVGAPFMVFATQNPVDYEGAFPLPESQLDRFLLRLHMGYPDPKAELAILREAKLSYDAIPVNPVATKSEVQKIQGLVGSAYVEDSVLGYIHELIQGTRGRKEFRNGASVRAGLALKTASQAMAILRGREYVLPEDVAQQVPYVMSHRLHLLRPGTDALAERARVQEILVEVMSGVPQPR